MWSRAAGLHLRGSGSQSGFNLSQAIARCKDRMKSLKLCCGVKIFTEKQIFDKSSSLPSLLGAFARRWGFSLPGSPRPVSLTMSELALGPGKSVVPQVSITKPLQSAVLAGWSRALPGFPQGKRNLCFVFCLSLSELCSRHRSGAETSSVFCFHKGQRRVIVL